MRILFVSNFYPPFEMGGYEIHCAQKVAGLIQRGHDVFVLTSDYGLEQPRIEDAVYRLLPYIPQRKKMKTWELFFLECKAVSIARRVVQETRPDVVYIWNMWWMPPSTVLSLERTRLRVIYQIEHNWLLEGYSKDSWLQRWKPGRAGWKKQVFQRLRPLMKRMNIMTSVDDLKLRHVIFVSHYRHEEHIRHGLRVARADVLYGGTHLPRNPESIRQRHQHDSWQLLYVARYLTPAKGVLVAVKAVRRLVEAGQPNIHLDVVGEFSPGQEFYRDEVNAITQQLIPHIRFLHALPHESVLELYPKYDVLLFCADSPEGLPLTIAEAMAHGVPVIGSPVGGAAEILRPEASLTFPANDDAALAGCINQICTEPGLWNQLSNGAINLIKQEFSLDQSIDLTDILLRDGSQKM